MKPQKTFRAVFFTLLVASAVATSVYFAARLTPAAAAPVRAMPPTSSSSAQNVTTPVAAVNPLAAQTLARLRTLSGQQITEHVSRRTGVYDFVRVAGGPSAVLAESNPLQSPETRARNFLGEFGGLFGMTSVERQLVKTPGPSAASTDASALTVARVRTDRLGATHVKLDQTYQGMRVLGGQLVVHLNAFGVTGVNGNYVPGVNVGKTPKITAAQANTAALASLRKSPSDASLRAMRTSLGVYHVGLLEGHKGRSRLAWAVTVLNADGDRHEVWVDAKDGDVLNRISQTPHALYRLVFNKSYNGNDSEAIIDEGNPLKPAPPLGTTEAGDLYHYAGHTYNMFSSAFGVDSFDQAGAKMRSVLIYSDNPTGNPTKCPNATWNGATANFCTEVNSDDVVSHEWSHAYTQYTHDLIYSYQSGALNESYSDIFGESLDLMNGHDQPDAITGGLPDNTKPTTYSVQGGQYVPSGGGVRWRIGEDVQGLNQPAALGILRDMWTPEAFGDPGKVTAESYHCSADDGGGVHTNSGIPNHAFAMLVDGKTFNGVTVQPIGTVRAMNIYFRAMDVYQVSSTNFAEHEQALVASCNDLIGQPLTVPSTTAAVGAVSADVITAQHCTQVENAMAAVEMGVNPTQQCGFKKLLDPDTPAECSGSADVFTEDWETGTDGWALGHAAVGPEFPNTDWALKSTDLPADLDGTPHEGSAMFAINPKIGEPNGGTCQPGGDVAGRFWMDSPEITVPATGSDLKLSFEHFVQTELEYDGGNVKVSVNGGPFTVVPTADYVFNKPNFNVGSNNALTDEDIWNGANQGELSGSWGTSIADLSNVTNPGDKIRLRFEFAQDGCNGNLGWFVDAVRLYSCPTVLPPTLSIGADYGNPDRDGRYTLQWTRPDGATGPDVLEESSSCGPVFADDAEELLTPGTSSQNAKWTGSPQWVSLPNPTDGSNAYHIADTAVQDESLTMRSAVTIPAGATAALTFTTRQSLEEGYDFGHVEVSTDNGATFAPVASYTGPEPLLPTDVFEGTRTVNLSRFAGQSVKLRFRLESDAYNVGAPGGWFIDNIALTAAAFQPVATVAGDSYTVKRKADGGYCYRVTNGYNVDGVTSQGPASNVQNVTVSNVACLTNVAAASNGATATASSSYSSNFAASSAIDGVRSGLNWGAGGGWNDQTREAYPDWLEVAFGGAKRVGQIRVFTLPDGYGGSSEPTDITTATQYGLIDYDVQYWDGDSWETVPGGAVRGNTLAVRAVVLADDVTTDRIRVLVHNSRMYFSRVVEVEAVGCDALP